MIIKIPAIKPGTRSSFARLAQYIADAPRDGEKVRFQGFANCVSDSLEDARWEIEATQAQSTGSHADKTYHMIVSFELGERPDKAVLDDIEQSLAEAIGLGEHQRISAVHDDTSHLHIHIAINKVHPETLRVLTPYRDYKKVQVTARDLEHKHGLKVLIPAKDKQNRSARSADVAAHAKIVTFNEWAKVALKDPLIAVLDDETCSWARVHEALAEQGVLIKPRGHGLIITTENGRLYVKPSELDRRFSKAALENILGNFEPGNAPVKCCPYEAQPRTTNAASQTLYAQYQRYRKSRAQMGAARRAFFTGEYQLRKRELTGSTWAAYQTQKHKIWSDVILTRRQKYRAARSLRRALVEQLMIPRAKLNAIRIEAVAQTSVLNWSEYLIQEAQNGSKVALNLLRGSNKTATQAQGNVLIGIHDKRNALKLASNKIKLVVHKNGDLSYGQGDDRFVVSGRAVHVFGHDERVMQRALDYAAERHGKRLNVQGDRAFVASIERLIEKNKLNLMITPCIEQSVIER